MYILFEGIDTCGKSTQIELIRRKYPDIIVTKEPGGTVFGERAREILLEGSIHSVRAETLMFLADRAEHYDEIVLPHRDDMLISDRGFLSCIGYAMAHSDVSMEELIRLNRFALHGDWPDHIVFFETDMSTLKQRTGEKTLAGIEQRGLEYLLEVQKYMRNALRRLSLPYLIIDAREPVENIHQKILTYLGL